MCISLWRRQDRGSADHLGGLEAEQWVRQLERHRKGLLREGTVGADPENLHVQLREFGVVDLPGREVGHSRRGKIDAIELQEDVLLPRNSLRLISSAYLD
jgi:hypothetical protein